ncbi:MAG: transposase, partial [Pseudomonadota bacterium]|nr:transposase [Pseudomonadota bacterium]
MTDLTKSKVYASWMAIDIAKDFNAVIVETQGGTIRQFKMANSVSDHNRLIDFIKTLPQPCRIGFEATGNDHRTLGYRLSAEGFDTCLISSVA